MKKIRFTLVAVALLLSSAASAQFSNATVRSSHSSSSLEGNGLKTGYKGSGEVGYTLGVGDGVDRLALFTTHGFQINKMIFAGAGVGVNYFTKGEVVGLPIYGATRITILDSVISPFVDVKVGYSALDIKGFFFAPSVGCRFRLAQRFALTVTMGYEMLKISNEYSSWEYDYRWDEYYTKTEKNSYNCGGLSLKVGVDF